jgi:hypothetical protein
LETIPTGFFRGIDVVKKIAALVLMIFLIAGVWISIGIYDRKTRNYEVLPVKFLNDRGDAAEGILYVPAGGSGDLNPASKLVKYPALISIHYGLQNREALQPSSVYLVKNGIVVLDIILSKSSPSRKNRDFADYTADASGAVKFLYSQKFVDSGKIYISGHSIGGNIASITGCSNKLVKGVIAVGYPISFTPQAPQHLLVTAGVFDELHNPVKMLNTFNETKDGTSNSGVFENIDKMKARIDSSKKTRFYYQSYLSDHYIEPTDPNIAEASAAFINTIEGGTGQQAKSPGNSTIIYYLSLLYKILIFVSVFFIYSAGFVEIMTDPAKKTGVWNFIHTRINAVFFLALFLIISVVHKPSESLVDITILSAIFIAFIVSGFFGLKTRQRGESHWDSGLLTKQFFKDTFKVVKFFCIFYFSYIAGLFIHAGLYPLSNPGSIWGTVTGVLYLIPAQFYVCITRCNGLFLNADWSFRMLSPVVLVIVLVEMIYPGSCGLLVDRFFSGLIKSLQNLDFKIKFQVNVPGIVLMIILLGVCIMLWKQIMAEGYALGSSEMLGFTHLFFSFIIAPAVICTIVLRKIA